MVRMLGEIRSGAYAEQWIRENEAGRPWFNEQRKQARAQPLEEVGARLRSMMPFLEPVTVTAEGDVKTAKADAVAAPR
jgi:ketol-acid reductoisomerase